MTPLAGDRSSAVELLERALAYTRGALVAVTDDDLARPTPCDRWDLDDLLVHMGDALDAFAEGAAGRVRPVGAAAPVPVRVATLQRQACDLLGLWSRPTPAAVTIGDRAVDTSVLVLAAALEVTVHGWDVERTLGRRTPIPADLARRLLPVATTLVVEEDRGSRFGPVRVMPASAPPDVRLLGFLGRHLTGPLRPGSAVSGTRGVTTS